MPTLDYYEQKKLNKIKLEKINDAKRAYNDFRKRGITTPPKSQTSTPPKSQTSTPPSTPIYSTNDNDFSPKELNQIDPPQNKVQEQHLGPVKPMTPTNSVPVNPVTGMSDNFISKEYNNTPISSELPDDIQAILDKCYECNRSNQTRSENDFDYKENLSKKYESPYPTSTPTFNTVPEKLNHGTGLQYLYKSIARLAIAISNNTFSPNTKFLSSIAEWHRGEQILDYDPLTYGLNAKLKKLNLGFKYADVNSENTSHDSVNTANGNFVFLRPGISTGGVKSGANTTIDVDPSLIFDKELTTLVSSIDTKGAVLSLNSLPKEHAKKVLSIMQQTPSKDQNSKKKSQPMDSKFIGNDNSEEQYRENLAKAISTLNNKTNSETDVLSNVPVKYISNVRICATASKEGFYTMAKKYYIVKHLKDILSLISPDSSIDKKENFNDYVRFDFWEETKNGSLLNLNTDYLESESAPPEINSADKRNNSTTHVRISLKFSKDADWYPLNIFIYPKMIGNDLIQAPLPTCAINDLRSMKSRGGNEGYFPDGE